jgi:hypothetical protein
MAKEYAVDIDITMSCRVYVEAESEEEAKKLAYEKVDSDPYYYARRAANYVSHVVFDCYDE